jgi:hypothetical protein
VFPAVRTLAAGDIFAWKMAPLIDPANGGSVIALLDAAKAGVGTQTPEEVAGSLTATFPTFTKEELLPGMGYGGTPLSRAVINVNVAFQELRGEPVTTNSGPRRPAAAPARGGAGDTRRGAGAGAPQATVR